MFIFTFSDPPTSLLSTAAVSGLGVGVGIFLIAVFIFAGLGEFWYVNLLNIGV